VNIHLHELCLDEVFKKFGIVCGFQQILESAHCRLPADIFLHIRAGGCAWWNGFLVRVRDYRCKNDALVGL